MLQTPPSSGHTTNFWIRHPVHSCVHWWAPMPLHLGRPPIPTAFDLRRHGQVRAAIKDSVEMPDMQADRIIRSVEENQGKLSNVFAKEMPLLAEPGLLEAIVEAIAIVFDQAPREHGPDQQRKN